MKLALALFLARLLTSADAGAIETCDEQAKCITFSATKVTGTQTCGGTTCQYRVCMTITQGGDCVKTGAISHSCKKPDNVCSVPGSFKVAGVQSVIPNNGDVQCQLVGGGQKAQFMLKDGSEKNCNVGHYMVNGEQLYCGDISMHNIPSCSGSGAAQYECYWEYQAPPCSITETFVTQPPQPVTTTTAATTTTRPCATTTTTRATTTVPATTTTTRATTTTTRATTTTTRATTTTPATTTTIRATTTTPATTTTRATTTVAATTTTPATTTTRATTTTTTTTTPTTTTTTPTTTTTTRATTTTPATTTTRATTTTTTRPTTTTTTKIPRAAGGGGDPHFARWGQEHNSFHGECDLVMVHSDNFHQGAGFDLHARTTIEGYFSYIETAALRVGDYTLQFFKDHFFLNGVMLSVTDLPMTFGGDFQYTITDAPVEQGKNKDFYQYYNVDLHQDSSVLFKFYKKFLTIDISGHSEDFGDSVGLLGEYHTGSMIGRSGDSITNFEEYGFEWQVNPEDPKLFLESRHPQLPFEACRMPTAGRPSRRLLRKDDALMEEAKVACAHLGGSTYELCIDDVMTTGDVGLATLW